MQRRIRVDNAIARDVGVSFHENPDVDAFIYDELALAGEVYVTVDDDLREGLDVFALRINHRFIIGSACSANAQSVLAAEQNVGNDHLYPVSYTHLRAHE